MSDGKNKKIRISDIILYALLAIAVAVLIFCAVKLIGKAVQDKQNEELYDAPEFSVLDSLLNNTFAPVWTREPETEPAATDVTEPNTDVTDLPGTDAPTDTTPVTPPEPQYSEEFLAVREQIMSLKRSSPDVIGYISIPEIGIKYPLVQRKSDTSNEYYLTHTYNGQENVNGSIYVDYRADEVLSNNLNTVIYGHNMRSGQMFGKLYIFLSYEDKLKNGEIIIATLDGIYTYKIFSAYRTTADAGYAEMRFGGAADFLAFCEKVRNNSLIKNGMQFIESDKLITLSTCINNTEDGRITVHGVLISISH